MRASLRASFASHVMSVVAVVVVVVRGTIPYKHLEQTGGTLFGGAATRCCSCFSLRTCDLHVHAAVVDSDPLFPWGEGQGRCKTVYAQDRHACCPPFCSLIKTELYAAKAS